MHGVGAVVGSTLLHGAAAAAAMLLVVAANHSPWLLSQRQGRDSIALAASMAAPPPKSEEPITVVPPEMPPTPKTSEPKPPDAEPMEELAKQSLALAERPSAAFADFQENPRQPPAPISETRAEIEAPESNRSLPTEPPKRKARPTEQALPRDSTASTTPESLASAASASDSGVVTDQLPAIVHAVPPTYPPESKAARETGVVKLRVKIDSRGQVVAASIHRSSGFPRLDQAALDAIQSYRFSPADGSTTGRAVEFVWPITFRLHEVPARR